MLLRLGVGIARRRFLVPFVTFVAGMVVVYGILSLRTFQFDGEIHFRLVHVVVFPESLKSRSQNLYAQFAVGDAIKAGLALRVRFEFEAASFLFPVGIYRMQ